jgi:hypothetical protein
MDKLVQEVRKVLQSVALHGYDLICAESDIIEAMQFYHEAKLKEELVKYTIWHQDMMFKCHALEEAIEHGVDKYLKQRNHGTIS